MACGANSGGLSCCPERQFVQDKVCTPWSGTVDAAAVTVDVYISNMSPNIFASGYLQYDIGPDPITINILDGLGNTLYTGTLEPGTSTAFTYRRFGSIQLELPATAGTYQGEFCITTRYAV